MAKGKTTVGAAVEAVISKNVAANDPRAALALVRSPKAKPATVAVPAEPAEAEPKAAKPKRERKPKADAGPQLPALDVWPGVFRTPDDGAVLVSESFVGTDALLLRRARLAKDLQKRLNDEERFAGWMEDGGEEAVVVAEVPEALATLAARGVRPNDMAATLTRVLVHAPDLAAARSWQIENFRLYVTAAGERLWLNDGLCEALGTPERVHRLDGAWWQCEAGLVQSVTGAAAATLDALLLGRAPNGSAESAPVWLGATTATRKTAGRRA